MLTSFPSGTLENEFLTLLGKDRNAAITARYLGLDGRGGASLQKVGEEAGITRERVRQISERVLEIRLPASDLQTPVFDRVISCIEEDLPSLAGAITSELYVRGLTASRFELDGILAGARLLHKPSSFTIEDFGNRIVLPNGDLDIVRCLIRQARKNVCRWGMSSVSSVARQVLSSRPAHGYDRRKIQRIFEAQQNLQWLDECAEWFWLSDVTVNRVTNSTRKILSVAGSLPLEALTKAIGRSPRMRGFHPPAEVFLELCRKMPHVCVDGNLIRGDGSLDPEAILSPVEHLMARIITSNNGTLKRPEIMSLCKQQGINSLTTCQYVAYSPIITCDSKAGTYSLIGRNIQPPSSLL